MTEQANGPASGTAPLGTVHTGDPQAAARVGGVVDLVAQAAAAFKNKAALISGNSSLTFGEVVSRIHALAGLVAQHSARGDRVVVVMNNGANAALLPMALWSVGRVSVPVNWRMSPLELANVIFASEAALVVHDERSASVVLDALALAPSGAVDSCATLHLDEHDLPASGDPVVATDRAPEADPNGLASISFTSGTLGSPKGVMLSHRNWETVYRNILSVRPLDSSDVVVLMGPLSHAAGTYVVPLLLAGATILLPHTTDPDSLAALFREHRPSVLQCVPTLLTRLVACEPFREIAGTSLRLIIYGGESIPFATLAAATDAFGPILAQNYGLTEAMMTCTHLPPREHLIDGNGESRALRHGVIGRPYPFVELVLRDANGAPVAEGDTGEITVRSAHVMLGYWRNPELTATTVRDGWLWTGDLARRTPDGYLELVGRTKDMIVCGGMNMYPAEVQAFLSRLAGVRECAVFGVPSAAWGEELVTALVIADEASAQESVLRQSAREMLGIRTPKQWLFLKELPRTANGKLDFAAMRQLAVVPKAHPA